jgi:prepilin-type processing-associated H-X9-DG protein
MSEWVRGPGNDGSTNDRKAWVFRTFPRLFTDVEFDQFVSLCANISSVTAAIASGGKGETWLMAGYPHTWYNHVLTPNGNSCQNEMEYKYGSLAASSRHGSGVNLLLADGSARFVNESIDLAVWRALGSREGGEQVEEF